MKIVRLLVKADNDGKNEDKKEGSRAPIYKISIS